MLTHITLSVWTAQGKAISEFRSPKEPRPLGHGMSVTSSMCNAVDFWLYTAVLRMKRCAELISADFAYVEMNHQEAPENEVPDIKLPFTVFRISGFL